MCYRLTEMLSQPMLFHANKNENRNMNGITNHFVRIFKIEFIPIEHAVEEGGGGRLISRKRKQI